MTISKMRAENVKVEAAKFLAKSLAELLFIKT